jgi:hypothetical protein
MTRDPADEPAIDTALSHYMEQQALAIALDKAVTPDQRAKVEHLAALRLVLMQRRDAFHHEAVAKRHARGEVYSRTRVAAVLTDVQGALLRLGEQDGRAHFEVDI